MKVVGTVGTVEHIASLSREGRLLADAAAEGGPDVEVPTCPGWRIRDLLAHTGRVHRWATDSVVARRTARTALGGAPGLDGEELLEWFREGHARLVAALRAAPADLDCWTFLAAPSPLAFWARRQAHETAVHRVDAESALGRRPASATPLGAAFSADGIDELLCGFHARDRSRVRTGAPRVLRVRTTDTADVWTVRLSREPARTERAASPACTDRPGESEAGHEVDCELSGTAERLYLTLWNRLPLDSLTVTGDPELARLWRETSAV
ncbi:maleylpyruvate isomerase family mycothiol-dependent enzyme [Streptomyces hebeiensis]|uniref:Maleylpyruvate isomerase family mycothiol-dependent enzyme n=1 Tax=Streptomyces hebeiensis TaxID=229486 RepID=A0ABN1UQ25_9ACTN